MSITSWLRNVEFIAPLILPFVPGLPKELIPYITKGVQAAEQIEGASGKEKLAAAVAEVKNGAEAINAIKPDTINPAAVNDAVVHGIETVVAVTNVLVKAPASPASVTPAQ